MTAVVLAHPENDRLADRLGALLDLDVSSVVVHRFPDGGRGEFHNTRTRRVGYRSRRVPT